MDVTAASTPALEIRSLRVDFGETTAVDNLSLTLHPGEIFGLAGPNGAGKTSTIRVLATLLEPTYGEVDVAGQDLFETSDQVHAIVGYMPDLAPVIPDLKVWEFLDLYADSHGYRGSEKRDRVDACLARVKLSEKRNAYGRELSRGMTQRVVLAKTLLHDPALLLLDEPASGMDPIARRDMRHILQSLASRGATVVISSHILSELSDLCTSVGIMHRGRLLRYGSLDEVLGSLDEERMEIAVEVLDGAAAVAELLAGRASIASVRIEGMRVICVHEGDARSRADLLRDLVGQGIPISSFTPGRSGIEAALVSLIQDDLT